MLVLVLYLIMLRVEIRYKIRLNLLFVVLLYLIILRRLIVFFLLYEMVFILIIFVIILLGYSYERLLAAFLMMFYSFLFSRPVLIILLLFDHSFLIKNWLEYSILISGFFVGSFIVKFPVFGVHYWLPVAHVEASTVGSMLLAGILLKLGSVGLLYVIVYMCFIMKLHWLALRVPLLMLIIIRLRDLKRIIAYSSVAHISIVFYVMMLGYNVGKKGAVYIMFYHGFVSPLIFWVVGLMA
jgi:NADH:ubiquinone oxidoreductase subunit 4 (subunit M)